MAAPFLPFSFRQDENLSVIRFEEGCFGLDDLAASGEPGFGGYMMDRTERVIDEAARVITTIFCAVFSARQRSFSKVVRSSGHSEQSAHCSERKVQERKDAKVQGQETDPSGCDKVDFILEVERWRCHPCQELGLGPLLPVNDMPSSSFASFLSFSRSFFPLLHTTPLGFPTNQQSFPSLAC